MFDELKTPYSICYFCYLFSFILDNLDKLVE